MPANNDRPPAPPSFYCPLTMNLMKNPVQDREGNTYERFAIEQWLQSNHTSPITRNRLKRKHLVPNRALQSALEHVNATELEGEVIRDAADQTSRVCRQIVNDFLSELNLAILDNLGVALLPTSKLPAIYQVDKANVLMILEAPDSKPTLKLYTHFTKRREKVTSKSADEDRVLNSLLRHKSLTLSRICDERLRFCFQVQKHEISSTDRLRTIFEMFVKVSRRLRKKIECDGVSR